VDAHGISGRFVEERPFDAVDDGSHVNEFNSNIVREPSLAKMPVRAVGREGTEIGMRTSDALCADASDFAD
jgi:hypothetical protein